MYYINTKQIWQLKQFLLLEKENNLFHILCCLTALQYGKANGAIALKMNLLFLRSNFVFVPHFCIIFVPPKLFVAIEKVPSIT